MSNIGKHRTPNSARLLRRMEKKYGCSVTRANQHAEKAIDYIYARCRKNVLKRVTPNGIEIWFISSDPIDVQGLKFPYHPKGYKGEKCKLSTLGGYVSTLRLLVETHNYINNK